MSTPRKRWFRVADSVRRDTLRNDELAFMIRLMAEMNTRWARDGLSTKECSSIDLSSGDLIALTGCASLVRARRIARSLAVDVSLTIDAIGVNTHIEWPKYAEFQHPPTPTTGLNAPSPNPKSAPSASASASAPAIRSTHPLNTHIPEPSSTAVSASPSAGNKTKAKKKPKAICPDRLSDSDRESLIVWAKTRGLTKSHCKFAFNAVKDWSHANDERRVSWLAATRNAMRLGWGLKGYTETAEEKYQRELSASPLTLVGGQPDAR